jgi:micrococcal nuclease
MQNRNLAVLSLIIVIAVSGCAQAQQSDSVKVYDVVDGDTIDIEYNGVNDTIRLLGVDTPEVHVETSPSEYKNMPETPESRECLRNWGEKASSYMKQEVDEELRIEVGGDERGSYGRLLAYVYAENNTESLNYLLVEKGYARVYESDFDQLQRFLDAEEAAREAEKGLWNCTTIR